jgi:hypothetical protein
MRSRHLDWLRQAEADYLHATHALESRDYEWMPGVTPFQPSSAAFLKYSA